MADDYAKFKTAVQRDAEASLPGLRTGSVSLISGPVAKPFHPLLPVIGRFSPGAFGLWAVLDIVFQLSIALSRFGRYPGISLVILIKEGFGAVWILLRLLTLLRTRDPVNVLGPFHRILRPLHPLMVHVEPFAFAIASLSTIAYTLTSFVLVRWNIGPWSFVYQQNLMMIGNIVVYAMDLTVRTLQENLTITVFLFSKLFITLGSLIFGFSKHFTAVEKLTDFLDDIEQGKLGQKELALGLEGVYQLVEGEVPKESFFERLPLGAPVEKKEDDDKEKKD
jgi:hypothetical protein